MSRGVRTLPIRRWLALALLAIFVVPALSVGLLLTVYQGPFESEDEAARILRAGVARWSDPAWQAEATEAIWPSGVRFVLLDADGREVYRSAPDPFIGSDDEDPSVGVRRVLASSVNGSASTGAALLYYPLEPPSAFRVVPLIVLAMLALTLANVAWFLDRSVVKPLAATSRAARQVAAGDLDVHLPPSRVREVAQVNAAFSGMSTALRESLEHRSAVEQERRLFIGAIVHDLRTPLFSLRGSLEGMGQGIASSPEKLARYVAIARGKAAELDRLISDLFEYSRLEYLEQAPRREPLDLDALLRRIVEDLQPRAEAKGVALSAEGAPEPCVVEGDAHLLTRAVENLLDNALRHTPSGGAVRVAWKEEGDRVRFSVSDTGPGIPTEDLPHLFEPLFRGETSRNRRTGGAGLGLAIARRMLQAHGGDLSAANAPGGGAVFSGSLGGPTRLEATRASAPQAADAAVRSVRRSR